MGYLYLFTSSDSITAHAVTHLFIESFLIQYTDALLDHHRQLTVHLPQVRLQTPTKHRTIRSTLCHTDHTHGCVATHMAHVTQTTHMAHGQMPAHMYVRTHCLETVKRLDTKLVKYFDRFPARVQWHLFLLKTPFLLQNKWQRKTQKTVQKADIWQANLSIHQFYATVLLFVVVHNWNIYTEKNTHKLHTKLQQQSRNQRAKLHFKNYLQK